MRKQVKHFVICSFLLLVLAAGAYADGAGSRAAFTRSGWAGARNVAMGKTGIVVTDDVYSLYWNPAGLMQLRARKKMDAQEIRKKAREGAVSGISESDLMNFSEDKSDAPFLDIGLSASALSESRQAAFTGAAFGLFGGVAGAGLYTLASTGIDKYDSSGGYLGEAQYVSAVSYLSYAWSAGITDMGISLKGLYEKIDDVSYAGAGLDAGVQVYVLPFLKAAFSATDLGSGLRPAGEYQGVKKEYDFAYPQLSAGASIEADSGFMFSFVVTKRLEQDGYIISGGIQYELMEEFKICMGISDNTFSTGAAFSVYGLSVSYAFSFDKIDYGMNNTVSVSLLL